MNNTGNKMNTTDNIFKHEHPFVCTDAAVFTIATRPPDSYRKLPETSLKLLLYKRDAEPGRGKWCLPGGFLNIDELPEDNIRRKLSVKAEVSGCWLEQLYTFCDLDRDPRARVISIAYLGLMSESGAAEYAGGAAWFTINTDTENHPKLQSSELTLEEQDFGFDHYNIIKMALERLRSKILYTDIALNLLPKDFTLTQMQNIYEVILGKKDQAANFRRKFKGMVKETGRLTSDKGHRPAELYTRRVFEK